MPRLKRRYTNPQDDILACLQSLASAGDPWSEVESNPGTKAACFAFRQRIYAWRSTVLTILGEPLGLAAVPVEVEKAASDCEKWLKIALGPRATRAWLDITRFDVRPKGHEWVMVASLKRPMFGPQPIFDDDPQRAADHELMLRVIEGARRGAA